MDFESIDEDGKKEAGAIPESFSRNVSSVNIGSSLNPNLSIAWMKSFPLGLSRFSHLSKAIKNGQLVCNCHFLASFPPFQCSVQVSILTCDDSPYRNLFDSKTVPNYVLYWECVWISIKYLGAVKQYTDNEFGKVERPRDPFIEAS